MFFQKKNGEQKVQEALAIFITATEKLEEGVKVLDNEKAKEEAILANEELKLKTAEAEFKAEQKQREIDFKAAKKLEEEKCETIRCNVAEKCHTIDLARNKATKVIDNINSLLN